MASHCCLWVPKVGRSLLANSPVSCPRGGKELHMYHTYSAELTTTATSHIRNRRGKYNRGPGSGLQIVSPERLWLIQSFLPHLVTQSRSPSAIEEIVDRWDHEGRGLCGGVGAAATTWKKNGEWSVGFEGYTSRETWASSTVTAVTKLSAATSRREHLRSLSTRSGELNPAPLKPRPLPERQQWTAKSSIREGR